MELSNINSAPHHASHISSITRGPLDWAIRLQSMRRILCCWSLLDVPIPVPETFRSQRATWPGVPPRTGLCPPALPSWGSGTVASCGCGEYPRYTQKDRHAERCSSMHGRKHRHSPHRHMQIHLIIQKYTLHSPQPHGCRVRSDYAVPFHMVGQWYKFYLSVGRTCDRFFNSIWVANSGPYEEIDWNCTQAKNHHIQIMDRTGCSGSAVSL
jgi:hypothetical protein